MPQRTSTLSVTPAPQLMLMSAEGLQQLDQIHLAHSAGVRPSQMARMYYDGPSGQRRVPGRPEVSISGGVATIRLCGPLLNDPDPMLTYFGMEQVVYAEMIAVCDEVAGNANVTGVDCEIDTPGGQERGFDAAFAALCALTAAKPSVARLRNCCSAGQWMAFAFAKDNTAAYTDSLMGSIGCMLMLTDKSKMYEMAGVLPCPVTSGDNKTFLGVDGLPITDKHKQNAMELVVAPRFAQFKAAAMKARGLADNADLFDGRVLNATQGLQAGLVGVVVADTEMDRWAVARLAALTTSPNAQKGPTMTTPAPTTTTTMSNAAAAIAASQADAAAQPVAAAAATATSAGTPATIAEMKAAFPSDAAFRAEQLEAGATMAVAQAAWIAKLEARANAAEAKLAAGQVAQPSPLPGNPRLATPPAGTASATVDAADAKLYADKVAELSLTMSAGKAHGQAQKALPKAYRAWVGEKKPVSA